MALNLPQEESIDELLGKTTKWAIAYGDLMSSLMILFLLLFSFSVIGGIEGKEKIDQMKQAFGAQANSQLANTIKQISLEEDVAKEINGYIETNDLSGYVVVKVDDYQIKVMMTDAIMFGEGSIWLAQKSRPILYKLAELFKRIENDIVIEGHTDNIKVKGGSNFDLSAIRARVVVQYFVGKGINPKRFSIAGYGEYKPLVPNNTEQNRSKNRRVEINIIRENTEWLSE
jgi:chemotaxis protein MotB